MSRLARLLAELCPDGVEYIPLKQVAEIGTGSSDRINAVENGEFPFYVRSKTILRSSRYLYDDEAVIIPGEGGVGDIFHYVNGKYDLHQRAYRIHFALATVDTKYAYYCLSARFKTYIRMRAVSATVTSIRKPMIERFPFPLPPLAVQREIVRILDCFSGLDAVLAAELAARQKQYAHYRNKLLTFGVDVPVVSLGEIAVCITKGTTPKLFTGTGINFVKLESFENGRISPGKFAYISEETHNKELKRSMLAANDILFAIAGATIGKCAVVDEAILPANTNQALAIIRLGERANVRFVFYCLQAPAMREYIAKHNRTSAQPNLNLRQISSFQIPLPPLDRQVRIAAILDKFYALTADTASGLPAEMAARRRQYEYYRDKLLAFPEKAQCADKA